MRDLHPIRTWIFDLDNTLYPPETQLFAQIEVKMTEWVMRALGLGRAEADQLRRDYWLRYGTTLAGLMAEHGVDPAEYLDSVHDITLDHVARAPGLAALISDLPGRRIVFTNGSAPYAARVLAALGLSDIFDAVYGVEHAGFRPKPISKRPTQWGCAASSSATRPWWPRISTTAPRIWRVSCRSSPKVDFLRPRRA